MAYTKNKRILLVEDSDDVAEIVKQIFQSHYYDEEIGIGYEVDVASTSSSAILKASASYYHLMMIDLRLEGSEMDGASLIIALRGFSHLAEIPIIVYAGHPHLVQLKYDYVNAILTKSDTLATVLNTVAEAIRESRHVDFDSALPIW